MITLQAAVQDSKVIQDLELELLTTGGEHSQMVKVPPAVGDYGSKGCVNSLSSTAVSGIIGLLVLVCGSLEALNFEAAKERLLLHHPSVREAEITIEQRLWDIQGAGTLPNPDLSLDLDGGSSENLSTGDNEVSLFISQPIEIGGKRAARREVACTQWQRALLKKQFDTLRLLNDFKKAFIDTAFKQEQVKLAQREVSLFQKRLEILSDKVKGGKISPLEENKGRLELALAKSRAWDLEKEAKIAFLALARMWGHEKECQEKECIELSYPLKNCAETPPVICLENHPQMLLEAQDSWAARAQLRSARADRFPDVSIGVGYCATFDHSENSLLAGFEMPLPLFDRNEAEIQRSWLDIEKQDRRYWTLLNRLKFDLKIKEDEWRANLRRVHLFRDEALIWAQKTESLVKEGVERGQLGQEDLSQAEEDVLDHERAYLEALWHYHLSLVDLEYFYSELP